MTKLNLLVFILCFLSVGEAKVVINNEQLHSKLADPQFEVVILGEASLNDLGTKETYYEIVRSIHNLNPSEKLCLGIEQAPRFNTVIEGFLKSPRTEEDYEARIQAYNQKLNGLIGNDVTIFTDRPRLPYNVLKKLSTFDIRILGIDRDPFQPDSSRWIEIAQEVYNQSLNISWSPQKTHKMNRIDYIREFRIKRNEIMAMNIVNYLKSDDCDKLIILIGSAHILPWANKTAKDGMQKKLERKFNLKPEDIAEPILSVQEILSQHNIRSYTAKVSGHKKATEIMAIEEFEGYNLNYIYFPKQWSRPIKE